MIGINCHQPNSPFNDSTIEDPRYRDLLNPAQRKAAFTYLHQTLSTASDDPPATAEEDEVAVEVEEVTQPDAKIARQEIIESKLKRARNAADLFDDSAEEGEDDGMDSESPVVICYLYQVI